MDLSKILGMLYAEKARVIQAITALERLRRGENRSIAKDGKVEPEVEESRRTPGGLGSDVEVLGKPPRG